jgi:release factor glutamine methyltransferase
VTSVPAGRMTVGTLLTEATERLRRSGSESARLDAEVLLAHVLGVDRTVVLAHPEAPVGTGQAEQLDRAVARREAGEPVAYIRGLKEFHGLAFSVDARALIPRPETELLVDLAIDAVRDRLTTAPQLAGAAPMRVWDVGTGAGPIAIAVTKALLKRGYGEAFSMAASDASGEALGLAVENAVGHGVADRIAFARGDLDAAFEERAERPRFDLMLANLPYVPSADVEHLPVAASFEPRAALDGGNDGLDLVRRLLARLPEVLNEHGVALFEIGADQAEAATAAARDALPGWDVDVVPDFSGAPRVLRAARPGAA